MVAWSGRRKNLTILLFILPTLLGLLIFNVYPIIYNTFISFTNRNQFRPRPDCSVWITSILEPMCWPMFRDTASTGLGEPYRLKEPLWGNYQTLFGDMFSSTGALALLKFGVLFIPLIIAGQVNKYYDRQVTRPINSIYIWGIGLLAAVLLGWLINVEDALEFLRTSGDFFIVVGRTILFVVLTVPMIYIFGLILALILNSEYIKGRTFFRAAMIIPWAASTMFIIMALIWQFFFRKQGTINQLIGIVFPQYEPTAWLNDPLYAFLIILLVNLWFSFPFAFNIILGALQAIPIDQYEAADVDGASYWQQLINITIPLLRPAVLPAIVLTAIGAGGFQMFGTVWAITQGGPSRGAGVPGATELVMIYAYKQVFQFNAFALAGAFAVVIFVFLFLATIYSLRMTRLTEGAHE